MADTITLTSTTDDEAQVRSALGLPEAPAPAEPVADPAATAVPEPVAEAATVDDDTVEEAAADAVVAKSTAQQQAAGKKRGRLQSRIDELVDERNQLRGMDAASQAELDALRKKVAALVATPSVTASVAEPVPPVVAAPEPQVEDFTTYEDYTKAVAKWTFAVDKAAQAAEVKALVAAQLKEERVARDKEAQALTQTELQRAYAQAEVAVKAKYDDYATVINSPDLKASELMVTEMLSAGEIGPEIAYYLGTHPDQCKKLFALGNTPAALKMFGKIEARVESALEAAATPTAAGESEPAKAPVSVASPAGSTPAKKPEAKPPVVTKAPDPITPVGAGAQGTTIDPAQMSYQDYREWRNTQERKRAGLR